MKKVLLIVCSLLATLAYGQYTTPGTGVSWTLADLVANSSGTVTGMGGVYVITQELTVALNDSVKITDNVIVKIASGFKINVMGTLFVSPPGLATFTAVDTTQNFKGFRFEGSNTSVLRKCLIEFGGGIKLVNADIRVEDCIIRKNNKSNSTGALDLYQSNPLILHNTFYRNAGPAIASGSNASSSPKIIGNEITENNTLNTNMPQINLGAAAADTVVIRGNTITGLYDQAGGIALSTLVGGNILCVIDSNIIRNNRYGVACIGSNITSHISNNLLEDNNIQNSPNLGGSGLNFNGGSSNVAMVSGNVIRGNLWGVTIQGTAMPNFGELNASDTVNIGWNQLYDNENTGQVFALYNNTPNNIMAQNNYWGNYNPDTVEMYIFHKPDDPSLGEVVYLPLSPILVPVSDLPAPAVSGNLIRQIIPNPAADRCMVMLENGLENASKPCEIAIYDTYGRECGRQVAEAWQKQAGLSLSGIPPGLYLVKARCGRLTGSSVLVVQ